LYEKELQEISETVGKYMKFIMEGLAIVRSEQVRRQLPHMSEKFEADLQDILRGNPYQPARDGGHSYAEEEEEETRSRDYSEETRRQLRTEGKRVGVTANAVLNEIINPARVRMGLAPGKLKKRIQ
jgi:hypothetical protein